ncbi:hypothetical protein HN865_05315 [Candidatus Woesearchaeota archaeon]|jgi:hypothetical protein|nr:hypothetical protein [Candidatus Woesearchaeota archaeon]MBT7238236.1 hypothetical protein [Candidatus Woesearchaeota archaeon]
MTKILTIGYHEIAGEYFVSENLKESNKEYFSPDGIEKQVRLYLQRKDLIKRPIELVRSIHSKDKDLGALIDALQKINSKIKN